MNKEVHYEGWLIKSPPTKRIWRARWRRRWFTLKQGEIPEQFCLEYYTDRNCRKLKGVIDLDQCEQVDCGLRLENRKQKFQYMFDIKTPRRTYYLAADTEADMRDWVNCICQVCHLHDMSRVTPSEPQDGKSLPIANNSTIEKYNSTDTTTTTINTSESHNEQLSTLQSTSLTDCLRQTSTAVNNNNNCSYVNTDYTKRETILCEDKPLLPQKSSSEPSSNLLVKSSETCRLAVNSQGIARKIPENLVISASALAEDSIEPSPALSTSSGPYIPISECFSGSPKFLTEGNPSTPLNNLDPKFYDTPRSHNNIGLNLTSDQSYSPKITNCGLQSVPPKARSGRSSPTDSESVFTDDEEWTHSLPLRESADRSTRPSDSSVENESFVFTYSQRFSKFPGDTSKDDDFSEQKIESDTKSLKRKALNLEIQNEHEKVLRELPQLSDTENTSPAIGPRDATSCVDESYDIPRSHNLPYYNMHPLIHKSNSNDSPIAASTPNLLVDPEPLTAATSNRTLPRPHCYTNAAPIKLEENVFRYDFIDQADVPPVNRKLKPKISLEDKPPEESPAKPPAQNNGHVAISTLTKKLASTVLNSNGENALQPPSVDRKSKPNAFKQQIQSLPSTSGSARRSGVPKSMVISNESEAYIMETRTLPRQPRGHTSSLYSNTVSRSSFNKTVPPPPEKNEHKLQYFDLDVSNAPAISRTPGSLSANSTATGSKLSISAEPVTRVPVKSSVVYNSVDFVKTDAFKKIREERKMGIKK